jgi:uncharacterized protein (DUF362 family)
VSESGFFRTAFRNYAESVPEALDAAGAGALVKGRRVLVKPNLVSAAPPPVTTPAECCEAVVRHVLDHSPAEVVIAEGCGSPGRDTRGVFGALGYDDVARRCGVSLLDLNTAPLRRLENRDFQVFPEIYLPEIAFTHLILSVPMLKAHSLAEVTGALKNQMGFAPPSHYAGPGWNKAAFHRDLHRAIRELNGYRSADLVLMDASVGLSEFHLGGPVCEPPVRQLLSGTDPLAIDREAARLLCRDPDAIPHLSEAPISSSSP